MPRIVRVTVPSVPHHITQRGNRRQNTFFNNDSFLTRLEKSIGRFLKPKKSGRKPKKNKKLVIFNVDEFFEARTGRPAGGEAFMTLIESLYQHGISISNYQGTLGASPHNSSKS